MCYLLVVRISVVTYWKVTLLIYEIKNSDKVNRTVVCLAIVENIL